MVARIVRAAGPATLVGVGLIALLLALVYGGAAAVQLVFDPGPLVRYGLPIAKFFVDLGVATTIGALVLACFALSPAEPEYGKALDAAAAGGVVWTVASAVTGLFTLVNAANVPIGVGPSFGNVLSEFISTTALGQAWLATTIIGAALTVMCFAVRNHTLVVIVTVCSVLGIIPMSLQGHAGDNADHNTAITAIWLHVLFASIWLGGLLTLLLLRRSLDAGRIGAVLGRYSSLALICFIVVALSGYVSAEVRVGTLQNLLTPYGILVLVKVFAIGALGLFGAAQRTFLVSRMQKPGANERRYFWLAVGAELAFMGIAFGVGSALARTATPVVAVSASTTADPSAAQLLTGQVVPPPITVASYFTAWNFDLIWLLVCGFAIFFYLAGVRRLRKRGDVWLWYRTVLWVAGILVLFYVTNGVTNVYQEFLFSSHMLGHMVLGMVVPLLLVPSAPVTLALRSIVKRTDGSRGAREWIMLAVHSRIAGILANPVVAAVLFAGSLIVFYYTPVFSWATTDHIGHEWMVIHFVIVGYLFVQALIGVDPVPYRAPYPLRLILLLATMAFHAFFGLSLITSTGLLLADWYGAMGRTWGVTPMADQQLAGGIAWSIGEIPTVILAILVAVMWSRSDDRESKRRDRQADRDGDAELAAYNDMLARRA